MRGLFYLLLFCLLLPACGNQTITTNKYVYDFAESVALIRQLLKSDSLPKILEDPDPAGLERLINNFSPAQMALESEILNCKLPVLVYFYQNKIDDPEFLERLAQEYEDKVKIITIDADAFFSIAEQFEIEQYPSIVLVNKRDEVARIVYTNTFKEEIIILLTQRNF